MWVGVVTNLTDRIYAMGKRHKNKKYDNLTHITSGGQTGYVTPFSQSISSV